MSIQGTKSTSGHKRQSSENSRDEIFGKPVYVKSIDTKFNTVLRIFGNPEEKRFTSSMPIASHQPAPSPEEVPPVARMPSTQHTHGSYTTRGDIIIDPNNYERQNIHDIFRRHYRRSYY